MNFVDTASFVRSDGACVFADKNDEDRSCRSYSCFMEIFFIPLSCVLFFFFQSV